MHAGDTLSLAVVPLIDMFNHHPKSKHVVMLDDNDMVRFRSLQAYTRGAQLWNCYGKKCASPLSCDTSFMCLSLSGCVC